LYCRYLTPPDKALKPADAMGEKMPEAGTTRSPLWLGAGMAAGLLLALYSLLATGPAQLPDDAVARVNDTLILRADYERALDAVAGDRRQPLNDADRRRILDRLIDEELLLQHALALGLVRDAPLVRATLVSSVIDTQRAMAEAQPVSPEQARAFYESNRSYFTRAMALHVRAWRSVDPAHAARFAEALRGGEVPAPELDALPAPDGLVPASRLATYLGRELSETAQRLPQGAVEILPSGDAQVVMQIVARMEGEAPPFEAIEEEVRREVRRRTAEENLRRLLDGLRESGNVRVVDGR
jgi:hypothetical protein